jgi:hypothetical protein
MSESEEFWRVREIRARQLFPTCTHPTQVTHGVNAEGKIVGKGPFVGSVTTRPRLNASALGERRKAKRLNRALSGPEICAGVTA